MNQRTEPGQAPGPAAVLWDLDGTLIDTEPFWIEAEHALVAAHGGRWTHEDALSLVGLDLHRSAAILQRRGGVDLDADEIVNRLMDHVIGRLQERTPWRPGALELLADLSRHAVPCGLVTMSWRRLADAVLAASEVPFAVAVVGDEITPGKPHPAAYLRAATLLGVDPRDCVALEDSPTGARSAFDAGCRTLAIPHHADLEAWPGLIVADRLPTSLVDLRHAVGWG